MFCANCGTKFEEGKYVCGNCGWAPAARPEPAQTASTPVAPSDNAAPEAELGFVQPISAPVSQPESIPAAQPVNAPFNQPTPAPQFNPKNPQVQNFYPPAVQPVAKPKKKKTGLIIAIVLLVFVLIFGGIAAFVGIMIYRNSDAYKVKEAVSLVEAGDFYSAEEVLSEVYTFEADAIREFINIEESKISFIEAMTSNSASYYSAEWASDEFYSFIFNVEYFDDGQLYDSLPESLMNRYDAYSAAVSFADDYVYGEASDSYAVYNEETLYEYFRAVQTVMLNDVSRNKSSLYGNSFTLRELQERVDKTNAALEKLDAYDFASISLTGDALTYCPALWANESSTVSISTHALGIINDLIYECENEAVSNQSLIDNGLKSFTWDEELYINNADPYYTAYVGEHLQNIGYEADMQANADKIIIILRTEILYALITGEAAVIA